MRDGVLIEKSIKFKGPERQEYRGDAVFREHSGSSSWFASCAIQWDIGLGPELTDLEGLDFACSIPDLRIQWRPLGLILLSVRKSQRILSYKVYCLGILL